MNNLTILGLVLAALAIWYVLPKTKETFVPEFLDQSNVKRTADRSGSSYAQETNHFKMTPADMGPVSGHETPFRVNMYNSFTE